MQAVVGDEYAARRLEVTASSRVCPMDPARYSPILAQLLPGLSGKSVGCGSEKHPHDGPPIQTSNKRDPRERSRTVPKKHILRSTGAQGQ